MCLLFLIEARPLHTVTRPSFRLLMRIVNPRVRPMSKYRLRCLIGREFKSFKRTIIEMLRKATSVCLTADIWSGRNRGFLGVTAHWFEPVSLIRHSAALACQRFKGMLMIVSY